MARWTSGEIGDLDRAGRRGDRAPTAASGWSPRANWPAPGRASCSPPRPGKGEPARGRSSPASPTPTSTSGSLDLASLASVRAFATGVAADHGRVDILRQQRRRDDAAARGDRRRLRAASSAPTTSATSRSPACCSTRSPRATAARRHRLQPRAPARAGSTSTTCSAERRYSPRRAYQQSKFANAVFGLELDRRLRAAGLPVISVLAHPGYSATNLQSRGPTGLMKARPRGRQPRLRPGAPSAARCRSFTRRPRRASRAASSSGPTASSEVRGAPTEVEPVGRARDEETARRLWEVSEELTGVAYLSDPSRLERRRRHLLGARPGRAARPGRRARGAASWDAIVVGGGHNGLTAAAYLARAGKRRAGLRAARPARRRGDARAPVLRPALRRQPLRLPGRACSTRW